MGVCGLTISLFPLPTSFAQTVVRFLAYPRWRLREQPYRIERNTNNKKLELKKKMKENNVAMVSKNDVPPFVIFITFHR